MRQAKGESEEQHVKDIKRKDLSKYIRRNDQSIKGASRKVDHKSKMDYLYLCSLEQCQVDFIICR